MMKTIEFFDKVEPGKSGGKGKNLIELVKAFFPVPAGFIVTVDAYSQYKEKNKIPKEVEEKIVKCYNNLAKNIGNDRVAVRSSASAEDIDTASFAGQYDSYLYVKGEDQIIRKIVDCWNSLFTERAMVYRKRMNIPEDNLKMAVIVQTMIEPKSAGVLFTANPFSGNKDVMIVESNWGCGETVVSGRVTPDHFEISKKPYQVITKNLGKKNILILGSESGALEESTSEEQRKSYSLTDEKLTELCEIGTKIESHYGRPQDIEWALAKDDKIFILQSRAITKYV
ncbi:phosphoenolpyruvate synthase [Candidatus Thiomargarita nelsonii]|uniref:Phosphoenolpyruvate synthase n=1 Tax=Candidatus Thiomargarita nelsonii TaxID=1003181 RepID=A0A176S7T3_9GAMM|nr:phosphoenolpyruvate synthase [Candidatus Thiomargarita nelsonii]